MLTLEPWLKLVILAYFTSSFYKVESASSRSSRRRSSGTSIAVNGHWGQWSRWGYLNRVGECSEDCGGGYQTRARSCDRPKPKNGGRKCSGLGDQRRSCNDDVECTAESTTLPSATADAAATTATTITGSSSCQVSIFQHGSYDGIEDAYTENTTLLRRNDDLSSVKVSPGCCVVLFKDEDYKGTSRKVCKDMTYDDLGDEWNDQVSSIMIERQDKEESTTIPPATTDAAVATAATVTNVIPTNQALTTSDTEAKQEPQRSSTAPKEIIQSTRTPATTAAETNKLSSSAATARQGAAHILICTILLVFHQLLS